MTRNKFGRRTVRLATAFDDASEDTFTLPDDLSALTADELAELEKTAVDAFDALRRADDLSAADIEALEALADSVDLIRAETGARAEAQAEVTEKAAALAARIGVDAEDEVTDEPEAEASAAPEAEASAAPVAEEDEAPVAEAELITASAKSRPATVSLRGLSKRGPKSEAPVPADEPRLSLLAAADTGFPVGSEITFDDIAKAAIRRASAISESTFRNAAQSGKHIRQSFALASARKDFSADLTINDPADAMRVMAHAADEKRLPGGSLVASGGWCSPSETLYELCAQETALGLFSLPEVNVARGGIRFTTGPDFSEIFSEASFCFNEQNDIDGAYDDISVPPDGILDPGTDKPCFRVPCPTFEDERLRVCGVCITAGILQNRSYPEIVARYVRGALIAHEHRIAGRVLAEVIAGSDAVAAPAQGGGATSPVLSNIELQVWDMRYKNRLSPDATIEAVLPYWVKGLVRSDLSKRMGVDLLSVSDQQIAGWFSQRGISPQYVYNFDDLGGPTPATEYPDTVRVLLYPAGTWVRGSSELITLENVFDSALFQRNDFTALFTEEAYLTAKMCHDSRILSIPVCPDGSTHMGVDLPCNVA